MSLAALDILEMVESHAAASGWFERVNRHEPKNAPGHGLSAAIWVQSLRPVAGRSGLASTSGLVMLTVRCFSSMLQEPQDAIDVNLVSAVDALFAAYSGDFTLDGLVAEVDLLGAYGTPLQAEAAYLEQDKKVYRIIDISLPLVVNNLWDQEA